MRPSRLKIGLIAAVSILVSTYTFYIVILNTKFETISGKYLEAYLSCVAPNIGKFNILQRGEVHSCSIKVFESQAKNAGKVTHSPNCTQILENVDNASEHSLAQCVEWVTFSTKCHPNLDLLARLVSSVGIKFTVIGLETKWKGFGARINAIGIYISNLPKDKIVIVTDAEDVIILPSARIKDLLRQFYMSGTPILFMSESYCWPAQYLKSQYKHPQKYTPYLYLNAGSYMGYRWAVSDVISEAYGGDCTDDQLSFTKVYLKEFGYNSSEKITKGIGANDSRSYIKLDWYNSIFQSFTQTGLKDFDFSNYSRSNGVIQNLITLGFPVIYHQNGDKKKSNILQNFIHLIDFQ